MLSYYVAYLLQSQVSLAFCTDGSHPGNSFNREVLPLENGEACQLGEKPMMEILRKLLESKKSAVTSADLSGASVTSILSIINFSLFFFVKEAKEVHTTDESFIYGPISGF